MKIDYSPEEELIYRAECMECTDWFMPPYVEEADMKKGLRRAKAWAANHLAEEHFDGAPSTGDVLFVQISRIIGNVA